MSEVPWYERWFGADYLDLYPHRDEEEARSAVELLRERLGWGKGESVLDLACGAGRHLGEFRRHGVQAVGLDLSWELLQRARRGPEALPVVRGDMLRIPFRAGAFDGVTSFFTSFGYFPTEDDDRVVLREVRRVLRAGGVFVLDFLNSLRVPGDLVPWESREVSGNQVITERRLVEGGRVVEKRIRIQEGTGGRERSYVERVRLYRPEELEGLFRDVGFSPEARLGDYHGAPATERSPRCILFGRAV